MNFLFLFLDGVGLGENNPETNPLASAKMPVMQDLLGGRALTRDAAPFEGDQATLLGVDATLGVGGLPQSATGQAVLLTGRNIPAEIGQHYGPKPNPAVAAILRDGNLFQWFQHRGMQAALLNPYPQGYFDSIASGRRLYSAIPLAATSAGLPLKTAADLFAGNALSADFTGEGWRVHLGYADTPVLTPWHAGKRLAALGQAHDFAFFEYWLTDYLGHKREKAKAIVDFERFDDVVGGLLNDWNFDNGLILITSDHGNVEDITTRRHTANLVPALVIGNKALREQFVEGLQSLADIAPAIRRMFSG